VSDFSQLISAITDDRSIRACEDCANAATQRHPAKT
jgi:hypothetical protein